MSRYCHGKGSIAAPHHGLILLIWRVEVRALRVDSEHRRDKAAARRSDCMGFVQIRSTVVNDGRNLTLYRRLKIDPLLVV